MTVLGLGLGGLGTKGLGLGLENDQNSGKNISQNLKPQCTDSLLTVILMIAMLMLMLLMLMSWIKHTLD